uniref:Secreted protein n=1 Tax=Panagrellus redivivus TaxID=6233 RepID=A0A7E4VYQ3_PANRE
MHAPTSFSRHLVFFHELSPAICPWNRVTMTGHRHGLRKTEDPLRERHQGLPEVILFVSVIPTVNHKWLIKEAQQDNPVTHVVLRKRIQVSFVRAVK